MLKRLVVLCTLICLLTSFSAFAIDVTSCGQVLDGTGETYSLTASLTCSSGHGVILRGSGNTLNCGDTFTITGPSSGSSHSGILVETDGHTISGCEISGFLYGINLDTASENTLSSNSVTASSGAGLFVNGFQTQASGNVLESNVFSGNELGVHFRYADRNTLTQENDASNNDAHGLLFEESDGNAVVLGDYSYNGIDGVHLSNSIDNVFRDNEILSNGGNGIYLMSSRGASFNGNTVMNNFAHEMRIDASHNIELSGNSFCDMTRERIPDAGIGGGDFRFDLFCGSDSSIDPAGLLHQTNFFGFSHADIRSCTGGELPDFGNHYEFCTLPINVDAFVAELDLHFGEEVENHLMNYNRDPLFLLTWEDVVAFLALLYS